MKRDIYILRKQIRINNYNIGKFPKLKILTVK